jgi:hypothetical protein
MVAVLKTAVPQGTVGSNPTPSASIYKVMKPFGDAVQGASIFYSIILNEEEKYDKMPA